MTPPPSHPWLWLHWHPRLGRWQVRIRLLGRLAHGGTFSSWAEAVVARNAWLHAALGDGALDIGAVVEGLGVGGGWNGTGDG